MKRMIAMVLAVLMVVTLAACSNKVKDIDGVLTGYVQVAEYVGPLAVIEDNGKTFYLATSVLKFAGEAEQADDSLLEAIDGAEKGKTIEIDGKKVTIWQSHQICNQEWRFSENKQTKNS